MATAEAKFTRHFYPPFLVAGRMEDLSEICYFLACPSVSLAGGQLHSTPIHKTPNFQKPLFSNNANDTGAIWYYHIVPCLLNLQLKKFMKFSSLYVIAI
jgi:hypothetical protein